MLNRKNLRLILTVMIIAVSAYSTQRLSAQETQTLSSKKQAEWDKKVTDDFNAKAAQNPKGIDLFKAANEGDIKKIQELIAQGADINILTGIMGMETTPLSAAANKGDLDVVKILVENGADINKPGFAGWPPIGQAATNGHINVVKYLIEKGANVNFVLTPEQGRSILDLASNHPEIVQLLKEAGAKND